MNLTLNDIARILNHTAEIDFNEGISFEPEMSELMNQIEYLRDNIVES